MARVLKDNKKTKKFLKEIQKSISKKHSGEMGHDELERIGRVLKVNKESSFDKL